VTLQELAQQHGLTLAELASACSVRPLLLRRFDQGLQPCTRSLELKIANALGVTRVDVRAACTLTTQLEGESFNNPIPAEPGEGVEASRIHPLVSEFLFSGGVAPPPLDNTVVVNGDPVVVNGDPVIITP
jgi:transcriptional regulator with XRE-family HTH domain